jgi:Na+-translocating ferredoxin:NAD+ oxidoreductase RnfG subunit
MNFKEYLLSGKTSSQISPFQKRRRQERLLALSALGLIALVWIFGAIRAEANLMPAIQQAMPEANHFKRQADGLYLAYQDTSEQALMGYVALGEADGYGGPLTLAVGVDLEGKIVNTVIADTKDTPAWMAKVKRADFSTSLVGKSYDQPFKLGDDLDGVTGATYTTKAIAAAALRGSRSAAQAIGLPVETSLPPKVQFGLPELVLLALFGVGWIGHQKSFPYKKQARWGSMLVGLLTIGFIYSSPLTLAFITKLILGYWPQWQNNLYFYFLVGGILFVFTVDNKNPYCEWFCPFGAAQECLGLIGGAKARKGGKYAGFLKWLQRGLALTAILLGVYFRSPGVASFELFGTLFKLVGTSLQFAALALVVIASLFILRPWCNFLCPLRPVVELIRVMREWIIELWKTTFHKNRPQTAQNAGTAKNA